MQHSFYAVYDTKAQAYMPTFTYPTDAVALRSFADAVNDPKHNFHLHPEDYVLFGFGRWDDTDGSFDILPAPLAIATGVDVCETTVPAIPGIRSVN